MKVDLITVDDLQDLKYSILEELLIRLPKVIQVELPQPRKWLKSKEARAMLGGISDSTLTEMRVSGLKFSKIMGTNYYEIEDITQFMNDNTNRY